MGGHHTADRIGVICNPDHDVFAAVAADLRRRGFEVTFFEPGTPVPPSAVDGLSLLANKKVAPESVRALGRAERRGVPTWNGSTVVALGARLVGLSALEAVGCSVPEVSLEPPEGDYVAKSLFDWYFEPDPELNGEGDVFQRLVDAEPVDYKYYAVDDGTGRTVRVLRATSKLRGEKQYLDAVDPAPEPARQVRRLMAAVDAQAIGVDFVRADGDYHAVDVNPAMSFREADMEGLLADSMAHRAGTAPEATPVPAVADE